MEYTDSFKQLVNACLSPDKNKYVGWGNPNAKILMIGKEAASLKDDYDYLNNADCWKKHIESSTLPANMLINLNQYSGDDEKILSLRRNWGVNTWSKYQKINDLIFNCGTDGFKNKCVTFLEKMFTTEINDSPSFRTSIADKSEMDERKKIFKESDFIQNFPVIILACSDYIQNSETMREIDYLFNVTYDGDDKNGKFFFTPHNWFYTHHNLDRSKLVIHTRQLSANVRTDMLEEMAKVIRKHLNLY